jgi:hypothetical protein
MSWARAVEGARDDGVPLLATGHSCRSQVKRTEGELLLHPTQALLAHLGNQRS